MKEIKEATEINENIVRAYYQALHNKDLATMKIYLHPDVHFLSPFAEIYGRDSLLEAHKKLFPYFHSVIIRAAFSSGNKVMVAYDLECIEPSQSSRIAVLITIKDKLIIDTELFLDSRSFNDAKEEIFNHYKHPELT